MSDASETKGGLPPWAKIGLVLLFLGGGVVFLLLKSDAGDAFVYSRTVDQLMADPDAHRGRMMRVEGTLRQGSIRFREEPCEWRFVIENEGADVPVQFPQCVVPDTFRDGFGISVTVRGRLGEDDSFVADEVVPRCPSKYEMNERLQAGEAMPHDDAAPSFEGVPDLGLGEPS
ncbi:MAG: cytochrome c maturation protein CcmE [Myxococcales bacterium]|nr:cytochrome c maturation protein CcmE [Myxococcales bacterium]